jgi:hypothetical protein
VHGLAVFHELFFELFEMVELFLLFGTEFLRRLRIGWLSCGLRARRTRDQEQRSQSYRQPD